MVYKAGPRTKNRDGFFSFTSARKNSEVKTVVIKMIRHKPQMGKTIHNHGAPSNNFA
jgi:hypothetical protein